MFNYFGSKSRIARYYPFPKYNLIVEPFAGSARYSLCHPYKEVWLNDKYPVIANIWKFLTSARIDEIETIPELPPKSDLRKLALPENIRNLMGFMVSAGSEYPRNVYTEWGYSVNRIRQVKTTILKQLLFIRHFKVTCLDYKELPDVEATWFVDPPYQSSGSKYIHHNINYKELGSWCRSRKGQVIVCEGSSADWLPFKPFMVQKGLKGMYSESFWCND
jgi:site-specific DNA-adenine methylase